MISKQLFATNICANRDMLSRHLHSYHKLLFFANDLLSCEVRTINRTVASDYAITSDFATLNANMDLIFPISH